MNVTTEKDKELGHELSEALFRGVGYQAIKDLLDRGADPNLTGQSYNPAMYWAAQRHDTQILQLLLDYGADINGGNLSGHTALHGCLDPEQDMLNPKWEENMRFLLARNIKLQDRGRDEEHTIIFSLINRPSDRDPDYFKAIDILAETDLDFEKKSPCFYPTMSPLEFAHAQDRKDVVDVITAAMEKQCMLKQEREKQCIEQENLRIAAIVHKNTVLDTDLAPSKKIRIKGSIHKP